MIRKILNRLREKLLKAGSYLGANWLDLLLKLVYVVLLIVVLNAVLAYGFKAWLYPVRLYQYYDECSYISMARYFHFFSPVTLFKDFILKNKALPPLYHEFHSRAIYWSYILSFPLAEADTTEALHQFRALFLTIATLMFFLLGHKLAGFTGGIAAAAFWIGTPILNYWGKFLMTDVPSLAFIAAGYLFLLYSDRWRLSAILGGFFLGVGAFTRFTTLVLVFPAPFFILAVFFNPFKRKNFQLVGELAKTLAGFAFGTLPLLIFTGMIYRNPLQPFYAVRAAVNNAPADDPTYYMRNIWIEMGPVVQTGALLVLVSVFILAASWVLKQGVKNQKTEKKPLLKLIRFPKAFIAGLLYYGIIIAALITATSIYLTSVSTIPHKLPRYIMGATIPLIVIAAIGFGGLEKLVLQLLRLPIKPVTAFINSLFVSLYHTVRLHRKSFPEKIIRAKNNTIAFFRNLNKQDFKAVPAPFRLQPVIAGLRKSTGFIKNKWFTGTIFFLLLFAVCIGPLVKIPQLVWSATMNREFTDKYIIPEEVVKKTSKGSVRRLQPEYNFATDTPAGIRWDMSISTKLSLIKNNPAMAYSELKYLYNSNLQLYAELNRIMQPDEVLYVDRILDIPFTPGYIKGASVFIDDYVRFGYSLNSLINKGYFPYTGYVVVYKNTSDEFFKDDEAEEENTADAEGDASAESGEESQEEQKPEKTYDYFRSINRPAVQLHGSFKYVKGVSIFEIYKYTGGKPFPYAPGNKTASAAPVSSANQKKAPQKKGIMDSLKEAYKKLFEFWFLLPDKPKSGTAAK